LLTNDKKLLTEGKLQRYTRRRYKAINSNLKDLWEKYSAGAITTSRLLRACARLDLPVGVNDA
jgi:hypothetical protein